jgi:uncharacterized protein YecE (DUF72 family)
VRAFDTVEVNSTFYRWPPPATFVNWHRRAPEGFVMSVKAPRGLTHGVRLYGPERWLGRMGHGLRYLGRRRGPLLVQLSPKFEYDPVRLEYFLKSLRPGVQAAVEFRHPTWDREEVYQILQRTGHAYVVMSGAHLPCVLRATATFVYVRLHGPDRDHLYAGSYSDDDLRWWAERIREWASGGREVYVYFNNDGYGHAVRNAQTLRWLL